MRTRVVISNLCIFNNVCEKTECVDVEWLNSWNDQVVLQVSNMESFSCLYGFLQALF